jgi:Terminase RNaseH-like domain
MKFVTNHFFRINAENGDSVKFVPNFIQSKIIDILKSNKKQGKKTRLIIVKGRQMGGSSCIQRIQLSYAMTQPNFSGYTIAHNADSARAIFQDHVKYSFDTLPDSLKTYNSSMAVGTSARSKMLNFLHVSEAGEIAKDYNKWLELVNGSFKAAGQGDIIMESTAAGLNLFYDFVQAQLQSKYGQWQVLFLCWKDSPKYRVKAPVEDGWRQEYKNIARKYKLELDPQTKYGLDDDQFFFYFLQAMDSKEQVKAEYPLCLEEAFVSSSDSIFDIEDIVELDKAKRDYELVTGVRIYLEPIPNRTYSLAVDPSTGDGDDEGAICVLDSETGEQVASVAGKMTPEELSVRAVLLGYHYNNALITCETNGNGIATMNEIRKLEYPEDRLYKRYVVDSTSQRDSRVPKFGFATTGKNRPIMISEFRHAVEEGEQKINDPQTLQQMKTFVRKPNGRVEHEQGYHDDCLFALMLANEGRKYITQYL